jgi:hypothetical protein
MVTTQIFRNEPSTPEHDWMSERECSRIEHLNMTSMDECCSHNHNHSGTPPQGAPVPQPVFMNQPNIPLGAGPNVHLRYPVPSVAGQYPQAGYSDPAVSRDVFNVGLGGPAR